MGQKAMAYTNPGWVELKSLVNKIARKAQSQSKEQKVAKYENGRVVAHLGQLTEVFFWNQRTPLGCPWRRCWGGYQWGRQELAERGCQCQWGGQSWFYRFRPGNGLLSGVFDQHWAVINKALLLSNL